MSDDLKKKARKKAARALQKARRRAVKALLAIPQGPLGTKLFDAVAKHSVSYAMEAVSLRVDQAGHLQIYLRQRSVKDTAYPGQWHCPGSVRRPYERWKTVAERLSKNEFKVGIEALRHVGNIPMNEERGSFVSVVFLVDLAEGSDPGKWFPVDQLPQPMVDIHQDFIIPLAVAAFKLELAQLEFDRLKTEMCDIA